VKLSRWGRVALLLLFLLVACSPFLFSQSDEPAPPQKARLCDDTGCYDFTWNGDHYDAFMQGRPGLFARFWIQAWTRDDVEFSGRTAFAVNGAFPAEGFYHGKISPQGNSIVGGTVDWRIGFSASGTKAYTLTWTNSASNAIEAGDVAQFQPPRHSKTNPNILLPPGAAEVYASYPDIVRAILLPEYALTPKDAKRPCNDPYVLDANTSLEIARFAYRAGDMKRGDCWLKLAVILNSTRARVIWATTFLYGWQGTPKDEVKGFGMLKMFLETKDPWDIWILGQCYTDGIGTPKDAHEAVNLTNYAVTHDDVYQVSMMIGADDAEHVREFQRMQVLMNPPTKESCHPASAGEVANKGNLHCGSYGEIDQDRLRQELNTVDANYANKVNQ